MTVSEDFNFAENNGELSESSGGKQLFGISITPQLIGILVAVLGIAGALYVVLNMVMPAWDSYQQQQGKIGELQGQVDQKKASLKKIDQVKAELEQAKQQQVQVLSLFASEKTLDTLLLDLNRLVETTNAQVSATGVRGELKKFAPVSQKAEPIVDGSLGLQVDGKLKRSSVNIQIVGTYEQTQSILRNIERLQPLLIVKDYQSNLERIPIESSSDQGAKKPTAFLTSINTNFQLQALMPLTPEEIAAAAAAATPPKK
ncbi:MULTISPECIES: pilus assembly protein PilO [Calothrix]|uniref:Pilus assembly protein PilO n=2 Tax=Calothrix TaxID=1186 RepID=A0ABR8A6P8_9CYAN|nr:MULTISPECIES: pilus assembly protein PilO [Calothrix]MBD2195554.1 pilus assembly protein PilO [Calothrix parietina FACHB-288]MBD2224121.1 pilus assembly protein PilO [Calothrix anomala FACHB-343]